MSDQTQQVAEATEVTKSRMFNITPERNKELEELVKQPFAEYEKGNMTNCDLLVSVLKLVEDQDEKYYLAYQTGSYVERLTNPFMGLFGED